jgi:hypothetical protein
MNDKELANIIKRATQSKQIEEIEIVQNLWSGYGVIARYETDNPKIPTIIVKHVQPPSQGRHPRGWNTDLSHKRKLKSYKVEGEWYKTFARNCDHTCRVPECISAQINKDDMLIILEDLDASGFPKRKQNLSWEDMQSCLRWLASFHATFLGIKPSGLWGTGTYWHLATRPDELKALNDQSLKEAAGKIDQKLNSCKFKTFVHGDAKVANFCFSEKSQDVAAVDFQYVGAGCGMKDVAYFVGSCFYEDECEKFETEILNYYFNSLKQALLQKDQSINFPELEEEWRAIYPVAWADFHRFLKGWSPGHWKINGYSERVTRQVIENL